MIKQTTLFEIAELIGGNPIGDGSRGIKGICAPENASDDLLCVVWEKKLLEFVPGSVPVLAEAGTLKGRDGIEVPRPRAALVKILPLFDRRKLQNSGIHPSAVLDESVVCGNDVGIGPGSVVSKGAVIGNGVRIGANCYIGEDVKIGDGTIIKASASIQDFVSIGRRVTINSAVAIGCDGFGYIPMEDGRWEKIPQIGTVVLEDDVEVGPCTSIDRATFGETRVRKGTKIGSHVHIAHNCDIGENCILVGFIGLGGSCGIGDSCVLAGMSGISDHVVIGNKVTVAGRSGVTKNIPDGQVVSGFPAREHRLENRFRASLRQAGNYGERIAKLEREIAEIKKSSPDKA